jgi:AP-3 complex subunit delta-1
MLRGRVFALPGHIQAVYVQNILKLFANILSHTEEDEYTERINKVDCVLHYFHVKYRMLKNVC